MVCLGTKWREKGKKGGAGWEEAGILHAVLSAGHRVLFSSFLRDAVDKVVPFVSTEAKQKVHNFRTYINIKYYIFYM